jgi:hypothetical protein
LPEPKHYQAVMLSSTFTDLREHRQRAIESISKLGYMPRVMEHSGAQADLDVVETSLRMVRDAAAAIFDKVLGGDASIDQKAAGQRSETP